MKWTLIICLAALPSFLAGCSSAVYPPTSARPGYMTTLLPAPLPVGSFNLDGAAPTVRELLGKLHANAGAEMESRGLSNPSFDEDDNRQWAVVSFNSPAFLRWQLGVQFIRTPNEKGKRVQALVRTASMNGDEAVDQRLRLLLPELQQALEHAFNRQ